MYLNLVLPGIRGLGCLVAYPCVHYSTKFSTTYPGTVNLPAAQLQLCRASRDGEGVLLGSSAADITGLGLSQCSRPGNSASCWANGRNATVYKPTNSFPPRYTMLI
jgi:hypothetical protein